MKSVYTVKAEARPRVLSRILHELDKQLVTIDSFTSMRHGNELRIRICAEAGLCGESRLVALLLHLEDIHEVSAFDPAQ
jgi:hypothetical protein